MHGRRKAEHAGRSEAEKAAQQAKVAKYQQLAALALARRRQEGGLLRGAGARACVFCVLFVCMCV